MKSIIFDLYGTLMNIHTDEDRPIFWEKLSKKLSKYKEYTKEELLKEYKSICMELSKEREEIDILDAFKVLYPEADPVEVSILFRKLSTDYIYPYRGVKKLLKTLRKEGYRIFLLSNAQASFTRWELKKTHLDGLFDGIFLSSDLGICKPNIKYYKTLIQKYSIDIHEACMIGNDYKNDILPAKELGLKTIYIESNQSYFVDTDEKIKNFHYKEVLNRIHDVLN